MPLVCTKNVTFLFFQSSTYNMLKIATFVYFAVIFSWARHRIRGPVTACTGLAIENFTCFSPSVNIWARHRLHGPVTALSKAKAHIYGDGPTKKWRKIIWACYRWNFRKIKTSRFLYSYTLGASFQAKTEYLQLHSSFNGRGKCVHQEEKNILEIYCLYVWRGKGVRVNSDL